MSPDIYIYIYILISATGATRALHLLPPCDILNVARHHAMLWISRLTNIFGAILILLRSVFVCRFVTLPFSYIFSLHFYLLHCPLQALKGHIYIIRLCIADGLIDNYFTHWWVGSVIYTTIRALNFFTHCVNFKHCLCDNTFIQPLEML